MFTHLRKAFVGRPTRAKLVLSWAHCVSLAMACARLPGSTLRKKILDVFFWGCHEGSIAYGITIDALPCSTTFVPSGLAQANVSHLRLSSMFCCSKLPFEVTGSAFLWLAYWMHLSRLQFAETPPGPWSQLRRTHVWQNSDEDRPMSGEGPHLPDDVFWDFTRNNANLKPCSCPSRKKNNF